MRGFVVLAAVIGGATLLAVLEIAGDQVRWTPQGAAAGASVGTPPAQALAELKALLARR